jgi:hypothetical protein
MQVAVIAGKFEQISQHGPIIVYARLLPLYKNAIWMGVLNQKANHQETKFIQDAKLL